MSESALITESKEKNFNLENVLRQINEPTDIILVEGLKNMQIPKIEVFRKQVSKTQLFMNDTNIIGVISDEDVKYNIPSFSFNDLDKISEFVIKLIKK